MDFDSYVVARRTRLVEHALGLGLDETAAGELVDRVLSQRRRQISRADDPDPDVYAALESAVRGPWPHRRTAILVAVLTTLVVATGGLAWWATRPPEQVGVPSSFALDVTDAAAALQRQGLQVGLTTTVVCEPHGLVVGSDPRPGTGVEIGSTVVLEAAITTAAECIDPAQRASAWAFLRFTRGGPAPVFADTVFVVYDGRDPAVLPAAAAADPDRWSSIQDIADRAADPVPGSPGIPRLAVAETVPPERTCGVARPAAAGPRDVLRLQLVTGSGCPFTVDLYRSSAGAIDAVVIYSGS